MRLIQQHRRPPQLLPQLILRGACLVLAALAPATVLAQVAPMNRLPTNLLAVDSPAQRVSGAPGDMRIDRSSCSSQASTDVRRRIVDIAVQEWAFFGFNVVDQTGPPPPPRTRPFRRRPWMESDEAQRVAESIAGYWAVTPDGSWILERQNAFWKGPLGVGERWRDPWSAAFISWTVCEAGVSESIQFRRSINHRTYIDQAIHARDSDSDAAAYLAFDIGERSIAPGDMLCSARRHGYRNLNDRRRHLGQGARTHCDIVVHVDPERDRILAIGGNVRGRVSLKLLYAQTNAEKEQLHNAVGRGSRTIFAHLQLTAPARADIGLLFAPSISDVTGDPARRSALESLIQLGLPAADDS